MLPIQLVRQANGYDVDAASQAAGLFCEDDSLAVQSQKDEADINVLVRRFGVTGVFPVREMPEALIGHFDEFDMMTAYNLMIDARASFMSLPPEVRDRFNNDPVKFVQFAGEKDNLPELRKMGLAKPEVLPEPEKVLKVQIQEVSDGDEDRGREGRKAAGPRGARKADPAKD